MGAVVIKFSSDWADEFDAECFCAVPNTTVEEQKAFIQKRLDAGGGFYFGTNEGFEDDELTMRDYEFSEISDEEYETFKRVFGVSYDGSVSFGTGTGAFAPKDPDEYDDCDDYDDEDN